MYKSIIKRFFDCVFSLIGIILFLPFVLILLLFLGLHFKSNPFFLQKRMGYKGRVFTLFKFKTMNNAKDLDGNLLSDSSRSTKLGHFLRKYSIDELPQLLNILLGDMSLVGPRPLLTTYMHLYTPYQNRRHEVLPGITGWAQINGRNAIDWDSKFDFDIHYVENISFLFDLKILLKTFTSFFKTQNVNFDSEMPIEPFSGKATIYSIGSKKENKKAAALLASEGKYTLLNSFEIKFKKKSTNNDQLFSRKKLDLLKNSNCLLSVKNNIVRKEIAESTNTHFSSVIHATAQVSKFAKIGKGLIVKAQSVIEPYVAIENHCHIEKNVKIASGAIIGNYVTLANRVTIGNLAQIGDLVTIKKGVQVNNNVKVGNNVAIGKNAHITKNVSDNTKIKANVIH